ncbi:MULTISPECIES: hypothetical protein [Gordonia]|uniref:Uncharacterized protein n=2 Tax=Gordonia TaxID=2053 RepID=L7LGM6_9ACTN|nr:MULTISPECIES: hypothetical protein [Gordonia]AUH68779.1 hypothetical protein CXX93_10925 [Gordonia sp. YC-JH1]KJR09255.1 hypothetical protein UG54_05170 [Gordonia sihwensis]KXT58074.1 hypothetical protein Y710_05730 [Gordonia sp. QH-12]MBY4571380.1 hypothetical protein [Gordonia sihwensis]WFN91356.1 hypothetical protein P5P27_11210 [Gordonia sihwensis]
MSGDDLERLQRWEDNGAQWEVVSLRPDSATIALLRCDAGEEVDRFVTTDPRVLALCRRPRD